MESIRFSYPFHELFPPPEMIERTMGYKPGEAPEPVAEIVKEISDEIFSLEEAKAEYKVFRNIIFNASARSVIAENEIFIVKPIIFNQIKNSEEIAFFICTAGENLSEKSRKSMKNNDLLKGYIYDVVGSEIVEAAADRIQEELRKKAISENKNITNRFSPGYCGWDVSEQHSLFRFFPGNFCGITLSESALMSPVKSVSGIIGIGREVRFSPYQCKACDDKNCIYRNRKR